MEATILGIRVGAEFFVVLTILIVAGQVSVFGFGRRVGLVRSARATAPWTTNEIVTCGLMAALSSVALVAAFFAFVSSFVESWQALWACTAVLVIAGVAGLVATGRLYERRA